MSSVLLQAKKHSITQNQPRVRSLLSAVLATYIAARLLEIIPNAIPQTAIVALDVLSAMVFAMVHGARVYRTRGIIIFTLICLLVGNVIENIGVVTGFPFGRYYFVQLMGPKLFHVPVLLGLAYIGMAYVSFALARTILDLTANSLSSLAIIAQAFLASCIMTAWDLAQDPVWSTVLHGWVWRDGGSWFGVPISNYIGWCGTNFLISLLFGLYLRGRAPLPGAPSSAWPLAFYAVCAAANMLQVLPAPSPAIVADPTGKLWRVADVTRASALVSIFIMGAFFAAAWFRLARKSQIARQSVGLAID